MISPNSSFGVTMTGVGLPSPGNLIYKKKVKATKFLRKNYGNPYEDLLDIDQKMLQAKNSFIAIVPDTNFSRESPKSPTSTYRRASQSPVLD